MPPTWSFVWFSNLFLVSFSVNQLFTAKQEGLNKTAAVQFVDKQWGESG
uniref:U3 small nucleolar RNA-associated protein NOL7 C-terminal domain-containing protein n=1 Tax=Anguilla anguilla TaxID=7936 RepID=A0A0E9QEA1_ANGAN